MRNYVNVGRDIAVAVVMGLCASLALIVASQTSASAETWVCSSSKYFTASGNPYHNRACLGSGTGAAANTETYLVRDNGPAPIGYLGARARAYWSGGTLCQRSATRYNTVSTSSVRTTYRHTCGGFVYSKGFTEVWNGTGYPNVDTNRTVNLSY